MPWGVVHCSSQVCHKADFMSDGVQAQFPSKRFYEIWHNSGSKAYTFRDDALWISIEEWHGRVHLVCLKQP